MEGRAIRRLDRVSPYRRCRGGCLSRNSYLRVSTRASTPTRTKAERARARCRSIQQKKFFPADRCRATVAKRSATLKQQSDIHIDRRRPGVEQKRRNITRGGKNNRLLDAKIDIRKSRIVARPIFCRCENDCAQNLAALRSGWRLFRFGRLGMKRTFALLRVRLCSERRESAMIGDCEPGTDDDRNTNAPCYSVHGPFCRPSALNPQIFS